MSKPQFTKVSNRDLETRVREDDHTALRLWLKLLSTSQLIENNVREQLRIKFDTTLPRFDLMAQLQRHPEGLSMSSLAELMMVSGGNITNIVKQLEAEGLVKRSPQEKDNRSFIVTLSDIGAQRFDKMRDAHEGWIVDLTNGVPVEEMLTLLNQLDVLKRAIKNNVERSSTH